MITCDRCGQSLVQLSGHNTACAKVPLSDDLARILDDDPVLSIPDVMKRYHVGYAFIAFRLRDTSWTKERMAERGKHARNLKQEARPKQERKRNGRYYSASRHFPKCKCGVLLAPGEKRCHWCKMEKRGVKDYHDLLGVDAI